MTARSAVSSPLLPLPAPSPSLSSSMLPNFETSPNSICPSSAPSSASSLPPSPSTIPPLPPFSFATSSSRNLSPPSNSSPSPLCPTSASSPLTTPPPKNPTPWTHLTSPVSPNPWLNSSRPVPASRSAPSNARLLCLPSKSCLLIAALLASAPFVIKRVLAGDTILHDRKLWMSLAVFVYFFSVSGTMHNIIRKMPMFISDRNDPGKPVFFYQGSGMQLGAEGFAIGFLYTAVGVALAATTHGLVRLKNVKAQRGYMLVAMIVAYWAVSKVIYLDNWKTGYSIHAYWPTSWR
ncbi:Oligosaccharyl transferase complex subunit OST3/OST6 protein [Dioscorea alata]|uniref:Oligosaccharyl transferase complex subunit OST3/OST6 protein n=1 Tax=Dioscorea alata TaxID=55571 RepID=A0ACB7UNY7_DIOAL|nr:Oligosaccharyl transferase complex subunit OST3/OST6 protein [Dioscorea alata]